MNCAGSRPDGERHDDQVDTERRTWLEAEGEPATPSEGFCHIC